MVLLHLIRQIRLSDAYLWTGDFCSARDANALILKLCSIVYSFLGKTKVITTKTSLSICGAY